MSPQQLHRDVAPPEFLHLAGHPLRWRLLSELARSDRMVSELTGLVGEPQNLVSYHLAKLRDGRLVSGRRSAADRRDTYYGLDLARVGRLLSQAGGALHPGLRLTPPSRGDAPIPEARVLFLPGTNFFFTHLPGVAINSNGGCDLRGITTLGTANISATIRYPFEPVTARPVVSNTVTKTVTSAFSKTITCFPKGSQPVEHEAAICVAEAHDITGAPFVGETVCFTVNLNAEGMQFFDPASEAAIWQ